MWQAGIDKALSNNNRYMYVYDYAHFIILKLNIKALLLNTVIYLT